MAKHRRAACAALALALLLGGCARAAGVHLRYVDPSGSAATASAVSQAAGAVSQAGGTVSAKSGASSAVSSVSSAAQRQAGSAASSQAANRTRSRATSAAASAASSAAQPESGVTAQQALDAYNAAALQAAAGASFSYTYSYTGAQAQSGSGTAAVSGSAFSAVRKTDSGEMDAYTADGAALWLRWVNGSAAYTVRQALGDDAAAYVPLFAPQLTLSAGPAATKAGGTLTVTAAPGAADFARAIRVTASGENQTPRRVALTATVKNGAFARLSETLQYESGTLTLRLSFAASGAAVRVSAPDYVK